MSKASEMEAWPIGVVEGVAAALGDTEHGLTGSEIGTLLRQAGIPDPGDLGSKRTRLAHALVNGQAEYGHPGKVVTFIHAAMAPSRYVRSKDKFTWRQDQLNEVLAFVGLRVRDDGRLLAGARATTLSEAAQHAHALRAELERRSTHPRVLDACTLELLTDNVFHAQFEAVKAVFERVREMTGETGDGAGLASTTLDAGQAGTPMLTINEYVSESDKSEQSGFSNLVKGLGGMFRNPVAHDPRSRRTVTDAELLEALTTTSMVQRRLDGATRRR